MSNIGSVTFSTPASAPPTKTTDASGNASQTLTQQDFLKLMVAQFTQQDPLSSGGSGGGSGSGTSDYINQLMAITNLTTQQNIQAQQQDELASVLKGATVDVDNNGTTVTGVVQKTAIDSNGGLDLIVNGQTFLSTKLLGIDSTAAQNAAAAAAATTSSTP